MTRPDEGKDPADEIQNQLPSDDRCWRHAPAGDSVPEFETNIFTAPDIGAPNSSGASGTSPVIAYSFGPENITYPGSGLVFHNTYGSGVSQAYYNCIIAAENFFQSHFTNAVTLNMSFDLQSLGPNYLSIPRSVPLLPGRIRLPNLFFCRPPMRDRDLERR